MVEVNGGVHFGDYGDLYAPVAEAACDLSVEYEDDVRVRMDVDAVPWFFQKGPVPYVLGVDRYSNNTKYFPHNN